MLKRITAHEVLVVLLVLLLIAAIEIVDFILPNIGWTILTLFYIFIGLFQTVFYYLTSYFKLGWSLLTFFLNFILWVFEQVQLERAFSDTFAYQEKYWVVFIGAILWATNKLLIDWLFNFIPSIEKQSNRLRI